jgi:hypothetical protein
MRCTGMNGLLWSSSYKKNEISTPIPLTKTFPYTVVTNIA